MQSEDVCDLVEGENYTISGETAHVPIVLKRHIYEDDVEVLGKRWCQVLFKLLVRVLPVIAYRIVLEVIRSTVSETEKTDDFHFRNASRSKSVGSCPKTETLMVIFCINEPISHYNVRFESRR